MFCPHFKMIETKRLRLHPLTHLQLLKYLDNDQSLEKELHLSSSDREISSELREALENTIIVNVADTTKNYLYWTLWTVIEKEHNRMVGDVCITGEPNEQGEVEIGYGTYEQFRNKGLMTEAVEGLIIWLENQPGVKTIKACTDKNNIASYAVLIKNKFRKAGKTENQFLWRLILKDN